MIDNHLSQPISQVGYLGFKLSVPESLHNGIHAAAFDHIIVRLPGLAQCRLISSPTTINLTFEWEQAAGAACYDHGFMVDFTDLSGPRDYYLQFTWDAAHGRCDGYFNGIPLRLAGTRFAPWSISGQSQKLVTMPAPYRVSDAVALCQFIAPEQIAALVPGPMLNRDRKLIGGADAPPPIDLSPLRRNLIFSADWDSQHTLSHWAMEGPGEVVEATGNAMTLQTISDLASNLPGHFVYWSPAILPASFIAEWEFKPLSETGLAIVFFAAHGSGDRDIFDNSLRPRDGIFTQYTQGDLMSYHITYFAHLPLFQTGRPTSNLRKNSGFYLAAQGAVAVRPGTHDYQGLRLIKQGSHIQFQTGERVVIDWRDRDTARYGAPYSGGRFGLRQMAGTVGAYRGLRIWSLEQPM